MSYALKQKCFNTNNENAIILEYFNLRTNAVYWFQQANRSLIVVLILFEIREKL
jgi:hypothetical protein